MKLRARIAANQDSREKQLPLREIEEGGGCAAISRGSRSGGFCPLVVVLLFGFVRLPLSRMVRASSVSFFTLLF